MRRSVFVWVAAAVASISLLAADGLFAQSDNAAIVTERQDLMKQMGRSFGPLVAVVKGESTDLAAAAEAAATMNAAATKLADLFPEGTAVGQVDETRAKPEIWAQRAEFDTALQAMIDSSAALAKATSENDLGSFGETFPQVATACGGCHEAQGSAGGKFRIAAE